MRRNEIVKLWRKWGWGRLYWKRNNQHWRNFWDSKDICAVRDGAGSEHFHSLDALIDEIRYCIEMSEPFRSKIRNADLRKLWNMKEVYEDNKPPLDDLDYFEWDTKYHRILEEVEFREQGN